MSRSLLNLTDQSVVYLAEHLLMRLGRSYFSVQWYPENNLVSDSVWTKCVASKADTVAAVHRSQLLIVFVGSCTWCAGFRRDLWTALLTCRLPKAARTHAEMSSHNEQLLSAAMDQMLPRFLPACGACLRCFLDHQARLEQSDLAKV